MREIESSIISLCAGEKPFATADDIANHTSYSKQTVLNNADAVVRRKNNIEKTKVGQANVYYVNKNRMLEVKDPETTKSTFRLVDTPGHAEYATIDTAPEDSQFDLEVHWYDANADEILDYHPEPAEIGIVTSIYGPRPVRIKVYGHAESQTQDKLTEEEPV